MANQPQPAGTVSEIQLANVHDANVIEEELIREEEESIEELLSSGEAATDQPPPVGNVDEIQLVDVHDASAIEEERRIREEEERIEELVPGEAATDQPPPVGNADEIQLVHLHDETSLIADHVRRRRRRKHIIEEEREDDNALSEEADKKKEHHGHMNVHDQPSSSNTRKPVDAIEEERIGKLVPSGEAATDQPPLVAKIRELGLAQDYRSLHKAALNGDWESAERLLMQHGDHVDFTMPLNQDGMTVLHIAANMGHAVFMTKLVESRFRCREAVISIDHHGCTPLHYAAAVGSLSAVRLLLKLDLDETSTQIPAKNLGVPLRTAAINDACKEVVWYLARITTNSGTSGFRPFSSVEGAYLISSLAAVGNYDICLYLFKKYPDLAAASVLNWSVDANCDLLFALLNRPLDFPSGSKLNFWERWIYHVFGPKAIPDEKYKHQCIMQLLNIACDQMSRWEANDIASYFQERATEVGTTEIIRAFYEHFPHLMDNCEIETSILLKAIMNRQENVYNFMMGRGVTLKYLRVYLNKRHQENALHETAKLAPYDRLSSVSSPAFQMQRELQWFKAVEKFLRPTLNTQRNINGKLPREVFTTEHKDLVRDAERWMRDTASSCLVVATLIITVVFAAAFTIPGGHIDGTSTPLLLRRSEFLVFAISDAIAMFSSATSILMFLSILTARYAEDDFLYALPERLILGLVYLLIALATMMITFGAALYIVLHPRFKWIIFPIIGLTYIPVGLFIKLQLPLIIFMIRSTYGTVLKDKIKSIK